MKFDSNGSRNMKRILFSIVILAVSLLGFLSGVSSMPVQITQATPTGGRSGTEIIEATQTPVAFFDNSGEKPAISTWGNELVMLSAPDQVGWFSDIFADPAGIIHVVWASGIKTGPSRTYDVVLYRKSTDGVDWSEQIDVAAELTKGAVTRPVIMVDSSGILHLAYRSYTTYYLGFRAVDVLPQAFVKPFPLTAGDIGYFARLAKDSQGRLHAIFTQNAFDMNCAGCFHLFHRYSDTNGATWSSIVDITPNLNNGASKPWILVDGDDNLHVVIEVGRGGDLGQVPSPAGSFYLSSFDGGLSWTTPKDLAENVGENESRSTTIGLDGNGNLMVAWLALPENLIYFRVSQNAGVDWSAPSAIPNVFGGWDVYQARLDTFSMATDSNGNIHLVVVGKTTRSQRSLNILELVWNGANWSDPAVIATYEGDVPEWPRVAIGRGNEVHVTWFVRKSEDIWSNHSTNRVWYTNGLAASNPVKITPWPTLVPVETQAAPVLSPTATFHPTMTPVSPLIVNPIQNQLLVDSENDYLLVTGISILPVLILIGIVVAFVLRQRQR